MFLETKIAYPRCGTEGTEFMPTDRCVILYECGDCGAQLQPKSGDCCVFCSYATLPCSSVGDQSAHSCKSALGH